MRQKHLFSFLLLALLLCYAGGTALWAQADSLRLPAPLLMLPMYDHFSLNYLNASSLGRGNTNLAHLGRAEAMAHNPATLSVEKACMIMELTFKPPIAEMDKNGNQQYASPIPFGMVGVAARLGSNICGGLLYSVPKSIVYDDYTVPIGQGADEVVRYPTYYLHQFTGTLAGQVGSFRLGVNLIQQLHSFSDMIVHGTFDRLDRTYYTFNLQPGVFWKKGPLQLGMAVLPPSQTKMNYRYGEYDVTLPLQVETGLGLVRDSSGLYVDVQWQQCSAMSAAFSDRFTVKVGYEKAIGGMCYKLGVVSMPDVYTGAYKLPRYIPTTPEEQGWWNTVPQGGTFSPADQLCLTFGFTYDFGGGQLSLAALQDVNGKVNCTQVMSSLSVNLDTFKNKKFLIFDK